MITSPKYSKRHVCRDIIQNFLLSNSCLGCTEEQCVSVRLLAGNQCAELYANSLLPLVTLNTCKAERCNPRPCSDRAVCSLNASVFTNPPPYPCVFRLACWAPTLKLKGARRTLAAEHPGKVFRGLCSRGPTTRRPGFGAWASSSAGQSDLSGSSGTFASLSKYVALQLKFSFLPVSFPQATLDCVSSLVRLPVRSETTFLIWIDQRAISIFGSQTANPPLEAHGWMLLSLSLPLLVVLLLAVFGVALAGEAKEVLFVAASSFESGKALEALRKEAAFNGHFKVHSVAYKESVQLPALFASADKELPAFHTVYLLSPAVPKEWASEPSDLVRFVEQGGNLVVAMDASEQTVSSKSAWNSVLGNFGLELQAGHEVTGIDDKPGSALLSFSQAHAVSKMHAKPLSFASPSKTTGFKIKKGPSANRLVHSLVQLAPGSALCNSAAAQSRCFSATSTLAVAATLETRTGARFMALGSPMLIGAVGEALVAGWMQGPLARYRIDSLSHELLDGGNRGVSDTGATFYRERDVIRVKACFSAPLGADGSHWERTLEGLEDVQYELKLIDVVARGFFKEADVEEGCLVLPALELPSKHGIYTLRLHYHRPGQSLLQKSASLALRQWRNDETQRPWLSGAAHVVSWLAVGVASFFLLLPRLMRSIQKGK
jgi:hypothetical protein